MARKNTVEEIQRKNRIDGINDLIISLRTQAETIQKHVENEGLEHYKMEDLDYLAISLSKVLFECDGVMPSLITASHYTR